MKLKQLRDSDRGVMPVIGVILLVAVTVILAGIIGAFVLEWGGNVKSAPPQSKLVLSADLSEDNITVEHHGGDPIPVDEIELTVSNDTENLTLTPNGTEELTVGDVGAINSSTGDVLWPGSTSGTFSGATFNITDNYDAPYQVQIIHTKSDHVIAERTLRP